ncbi:hypothetical protein Y032_0033g2726 [Ancylostoma ceylanicum]|uniref:MEIS N-terminal domain-containing protein n=1 Tax=Ancylostoma ceylanicum TaxID=53326 RepID=A0A016UMH0_9BILA|nr:hypothetical protein Y032_0033g2726 [Ancylostoma ceylanicum]
MSNENIMRKLFTCTDEVTYLELKLGFLSTISSVPHIFCIWTGRADVVEEMAGIPGPSSEATSTDDEKKSRLLHEALTKASAARASKKMKGMQPFSTTICLEAASSSTTSQLTDVELIKCHPLMPVLELLCEKCGDATHTMQPRAFQMNDVCQVRHLCSANPVITR